MAYQLKEPCGIAVSKISRKPGYTYAHHHITYLRTSRICKDFLDFRICNGLRSKKKCGKGAYPCNHFKKLCHTKCCNSKEQRSYPSYKKYTGLNHCSGMNQCRNRGWPCHSFQKPFVQRKLRGFAYRPSKK